LGFRIIRFPRIERIAVLGFRTRSAIACFHAGIATDQQNSICNKISKLD
jgi:hypothetical protein